MSNVTKIVQRVQMTKNTNKFATTIHQLRNTTVLGSAEGLTGIGNHQIKNWVSCTLVLSVPVTLGCMREFTVPIEEECPTCSQMSALAAPQLCCQFLDLSGLATPPIWLVVLCTPLCTKPARTLLFHVEGHKKNTASAQTVLCTWTQAPEGRPWL